MKKIFLSVFLMIFVTGAFAQQGTIYDFKATTLDGQPFDLSSFKGKKVLVVNTASKCGLTPQYALLQKLYETYKDRNFVIVGFPANNFNSQEPGSNAEITLKSLNGVVDAEVQWNFQKFMINEQGQLVGFASPKEKPDSEKIISWIEGRKTN